MFLIPLLGFSFAFVSVTFENVAAEDRCCANHVSAPHRSCCKSECNCEMRETPSSRVPDYPLSPYNSVAYSGLSIHAVVADSSKLSAAEGVTFVNTKMTVRGPTQVYLHILNLLI